MPRFIMEMGERITVFVSESFASDFAGSVTLALMSAFTRSDADRRGPAPDAILAWQWERNERARV
jgi:hypothetical protein